MYFIKKKFVYKKYPELYFEDYKNHKIVFNQASNNHSLVLLDDEQWQIFNAIDGKLNVDNIVKKLKNTIPEEYIKDTLSYLMDRNIIYTLNFKNKLKKLKKLNNKLFPNSVSINVVNGCNLACDYCFVDKSNKKILDIEDGKKYLEKIFQLNKKYKSKTIKIIFSGNGEPLLNFDNIVKWVDYINERKKHYKIEQVRYSLITNGTLIDEEKAKLLKSLNISITLSLDGILEDDCNFRKYNNGSNAFNDIMRGYNHLKDQGIDFGVNVVINPLNIKGLPQFIEFLANEQKRFLLILLKYPGTENSDFVLDIPVYIENMKKVYTFIRENLEKYPIFKRSNLLDMIDVKKASYYYCALEKNRGISLNTDGYCVGCELPDSTYGHILDKDIEKQLKAVKEKYNVSVEEKGNCKDCQWKYICVGGCPLSTWNKYQTVYRESPYCEFIKEMIPELIKIEAEKDLIKRKQGLMC